MFYTLMNQANFHRLRAILDKIYIFHGIYAETSFCFRWLKNSVTEIGKVVSIPLTFNHLK